MLKFKWSRSGFAMMPAGDGCVILNISSHMGIHASMCTHPRAHKHTHTRTHACTSQTSNHQSQTSRPIHTTYGMTHLTWIQHLQIKHGINVEYTPFWLESDNVETLKHHGKQKYSQSHQLMIQSLFRSSAWNSACDNNELKTVYSSTNSFNLILTICSTNGKCPTVPAQCTFNC